MGMRTSRAMYSVATTIADMAIATSVPSALTLIETNSRASLRHPPPSVEGSAERRYEVGRSAARFFPPARG